MSAVITIRPNDSNSALLKFAIERFERDTRECGEQITKISTLITEWKTCYENFLNGRNLPVDIAVWGKREATHYAHAQYAASTMSNTIALLGKISERLAVPVDDKSLKTLGNFGAPVSTLEQSIRLCKAAAKILRGLAAQAAIQCGALHAKMSPADRALYNALNVLYHPTPGLRIAQGVAAIFSPTTPSLVATAVGSTRLPTVEETPLSTEAEEEVEEETNPAKELESLEALYQRLERLTTESRERTKSFVTVEKTDESATPRRGNSFNVTWSMQWSDGPAEAAPAAPSSRENTPPLEREDLVEGSEEEDGNQSVPLLHTAEQPPEKKSEIEPADGTTDT